MLSLEILANENNGCYSTQMCHIMRVQPREVVKFLTKHSDLKVGAALLELTIICIFLFFEFFGFLRAYDSVFMEITRVPIPTYDLGMIGLWTLFFMVHAMGSVRIFSLHARKLKRMQRRLAHTERSERQTISFIQLSDFLKDNKSMGATNFISLALALLVFPFACRPKNISLQAVKAALGLLVSLQFIISATFFIAELWIPVIVLEMNLPYLSDGVGVDPDHVDAVAASMSMRDLELSQSENLASDEASNDSGLFGIETCVICLSDYNENDQVRRLQCGHVFHTACVDVWFDRSSTCPMCKTNIINL